MKKTLYLLLLITGFVNGQIVTIPDANFKAKLLAADVTNSIASTATNATIPDTFNKIDVNNDGEIQQSEAAGVTLLNVSNCGISDLTGIEAFVSLRVLKCQSNQITSLDANNFTFLVWLECQYNNIPELEVSNLTALQTLFCFNNQMTSLNLNNLPSLSNLYCGNNQLTSLNLGGSPILFLLGCENNQLTSLNVSGLTNLQSIECQSNQLTTLNASGLVNLEYLNCQSNQLTALDVSDSSNLAVLFCGSNLFTTLDLNNNTALKALYMYGCPNIQTLFLHNGSDESTNIDPGSWFENWVNCPNLLYICADENEVIPLQDVLDTINFPIPSIVVNSYCSFNPGGDYNTITGALISDANSNGCDTNDAFIPYIKIRMQQWGLDSYAFSNTLGTYTFYTTFADQIVEPIFENPTFFNASPASAVVSFPDTNLTVSQDFCVTPNGIHPDLEIVLAPIIPARPGFDATYKIVYKNIGNQTLSGEVNFTYDDTVLDYINATPTQDSQFFGGVTWNYTNLLPFESRSIFVIVNVNSPTETPAVNIDDALIFTVTSYPVGVDENVLNNTFQFNQTVVGSFDPNDITCLQGDVVAPSEIGNYLHYMVNFENTGTAPAENVVVKVVIDSAQFDINSLQLLNTSHEVNAKVTGNVIEFIFQNIYLETGGHGNVLLKMKSNNNLQVGAIVNKQADIFFDYNFPIETNMASTAFQTLSVGNIDFGNAITIYPNPATAIVSVKTDNLTLKSLQLYDVQGRLLINRIIENESSTIDISSYATGIYYLKVITDKGATTQKIVKK